ncbi:MAG: hypothetical protein V1712_04050 [Patescibacteria group bacterium]
MLIPKSLPLSKVIILSAIVLIALGFTSYFVYENLLKDKITSTIENSFVKSRDQLFDKPVVLPDVQDFDAKFFDNQVIEQLQNYGPLPAIIDPDNIGRDNPFAPLFIKSVSKTIKK